MEITEKITACTICKDRFAATETAHDPRPVVWFHPKARLLIAGQAPGIRVHETGRPFTDPSGDRLRDWMGVTEAEFYDQRRVAVVPMAFCFPGYNNKGADLPPPKICAKTWRADVLSHLSQVELTLLVGGYAQKYHLKNAGSVTETVKAWRDHWPRVLPLPHPSWRNTGWMKKNPWFAAELLPELKRRVRELFDG